MKDIELYNDHFQNWKKYINRKAQLIIADPPYNLGTNAYASNPSWYIDGDNKNGESELAGKEFFDTDKNFKPAEFMHFCSQMLVKEPKKGITEEEIESGEYGQVKSEKVGQKNKSQAPCMILFCAFEQMQYYIDLFDLVRDTDSPRIHPTQKPVPLLRRLIEIFTDEGDVVIDPCAGSGSTLRAAAMCNRKAYGFEIKKEFFKVANEKMLRNITKTLF